MRTMRLKAMVVVFVATVAAAVSDTPPAGFRVSVADAAPAPLVEAVREAGAMEAAVVTIIQFVALDSPRSEESLRALDAFVARPLAAKGTQVIAVAVKANRAGAEALARKVAVSFPVIADPDGTLFGGVAEAGFPRTLALANDGTILYTQAGYKRGREAEWRALATGLRGDTSHARIMASKQRAERRGDFSEELGARSFVGKPAPKVPIEKWVTENPGALAGKYVLYEFWATWCGPCRASLEMAEKQHGGRSDRLVTIAISDEDEATIRAYVRSKGLKQPIAIDTKARAKAELAIQGIPHAILVDPNGVVVWQGHPGVLWSDDGALLGQLLARPLDAVGER